MRSDQPSSGLVNVFSGKNPLFSFALVLASTTTVAIAPPAFADSLYLIDSENLTVTPLLANSKPSYLEQLKETAEKAYASLSQIRYAVISDALAQSPLGGSSLGPGPSPYPNPDPDSDPDQNPDPNRSPDCGPEGCVDMNNYVQCLSSVMMCLCPEPTDPLTMALCFANASDACNAALKQSMDPDGDGLNNNTGWDICPRPQTSPNPLPAPSQPRPNLNPGPEPDPLPLDPTVCEERLADQEVLGFTSAIPVLEEPCAPVSPEPFPVSPAPYPSPNTVNPPPYNPDPVDPNPDYSPSPSPGLTPWPGPVPEPAPYPSPNTVNPPPYNPNPVYPRPVYPNPAYYPSPSPGPWPGPVPAPAPYPSPNRYNPNYYPHYYPSYTPNPTYYPRPSPGPKPGPVPAPAPYPSPNRYNPNYYPHYYPSYTPNPAYNPSPSPGPKPGPAPYPGPSPYPSPNRYNPNYYPNYYPSYTPNPGQQPAPSPYPGPGPSPSPSPGPYPGPNPNPDSCSDSATEWEWWGGTRDNLPFIPAKRQDDRYRDLCITSYSGDALTIDPLTGEVNNTPPMKYLTAGHIGGSKVPPGACMPVKSTPLLSLEHYRLGNVNYAFNSYLNIADRFDYTNIPTAYKNENNNYLKTNVFYGQDSKLFCHPQLKLAPPVQLDGSAGKVIQAANFRRDQALNCYDQYIMARAVSPRFFWEPQGSALAQYMMNDPNMPDPRPDDIIVKPRRIILDYCQPLINGNVSITTPIGSTRELFAGFAPVLHSNHPLIDESEYLYSDYIGLAWYNLLGTTSRTGHLSNQFSRGRYSNAVMDQPIPVPTIPPTGLPCTQWYNANLGGGSGGGVVTFSKPCPRPAPAAEPGPAPACAVPTEPVPEDLAYRSKGKIENYCPNVEKINEPTNPFSPRFDYTITDRDYSSATSIVLPWPMGPDCKSECASERRIGYTDYNYRDSTNYSGCVPFNKNGAVDRDEYFGNQDRTLNPEVMCAVVPVDIMSWRKDAFENCIMQRININMNAWIAGLDGVPETLGDNMTPPSHGFGRQGQHRGGFVQPCATLWYQSDTYEQCPTRTSIQQCCHIILKDVVPMNFLKQRTCEGLEEMRRQDPPPADGRRYAHPVDDGIIIDPVVPETATNVAGYSQSTGGGPGFGLGTYTPTLLEPFGDVLDRRFGNTRYDNEIAIQKMQKDTFCSAAEPADYHFRNYVKSYIPPVTDLNHPEGTPQDSNGILGAHMPYMRWWDTGVSAGNTRKGGSYVNTLGTFDVIVGVGREGRNKWDADTERKGPWPENYYEAQFNAAEAALNAATVNFDKSLLRWVKQLLTPYKQENGLSPSQRQAGNIGGWTELLGHQMWSMRLHNFNCLGRYEKLFKDGDSETVALSRSATGFTTKDGVQLTWPLGWRGYGSDTTANGWPNLRGQPGSASGGNYRGTEIIERGLSRAQPGDIIALGGYDGKTARRLAFVISVDVMTGNYVHVIEWNAGKFPTAAGVTNQWGHGQERQIWRQKTSVSAADIQSGTAENIGATAMINGERQPSCLDGDLRYCVLSNDEWDEIIVYHRDRSVFKCGGSLMPTYEYDKKWCILGQPDKTGSVFFHADISRTLNQQVVPGTTTQVSVPADIIQQIGNCINAGFDPPPIWLPNCGLGEYLGVGAGAQTKSSFCPPFKQKPDGSYNFSTTPWGSCSAAAQKDPNNPGDIIYTKPPEPQN